MSGSILKEAMETVLEKSEPVVRKANSAKKKAEPVTEAAKAAGKQFSEACVPKIYVQFSSRQYDCDELTERCKADFCTKHKDARIHSCKLYIKPEDGKVYYVINNIEDKLPL